MQICVHCIWSRSCEVIILVQPVLVLYVEVSSATERLLRGRTNISLCLHVLDDPLVDEQKRPLLSFRMKREEVGDAVEVLEELAASAAVGAPPSSSVGTWHENRQKRLYYPDGGCFVMKVGQIFRMFPQHAFLRALFGGFHTGRLRRRRVFHLDRLHFGREKERNN